MTVFAIRQGAGTDVPDSRAQWHLTGNNDCQKREGLLKDHGAGTVKSTSKQHRFLTRIVTRCNGNYCVLKIRLIHYTFTPLVGRVAAISMG
jgi:hypothetical protein